MSDWLALAILAAVSIRFWWRFPDQLPERWRGPAEQWSLDHIGVPLLRMADRWRGRR